MSTIGLCCIALIAYFCLWPVPVDPVAWTPPPSPGLVGPYARNRALSTAELFPLGTGFGPESVTFGPDGLIYSALRDGRIVRLAPRASGSAGPSFAEPQTFADTGGSPGGMAFDARGHLIVADAHRGLLDISPSGVITPLVVDVNGSRMLFPDAVTIASDGIVWFTDGSQRFSEHHDAYEFLEGRATGRLLNYDPATREVSVRLEGLRFANGVAFGPDEAYLLVNESTGYRTTRFWIKGPDAGKAELFASNYPGIPDNVAFDGQRFWIGLVYHRDPAIDWLSGQSAFLKKVVLRIPFVEALAGPANDGFLIALDLDGNVVANLQDTTGLVASVTGAVERDGWLYLGSLSMPAVARIPTP